MAFYLKQKKRVENWRGRGQVRIQRYNTHNCVVYIEGRGRSSLWSGGKCAVTRNGLLTGPEVSVSCLHARRGSQRADPLGGLRTHVPTNYEFPTYLP